MPDQEPQNVPERKCEQKLENPRGRLVALQVVEIDEESLKIQWVSPTYKPTRFSANGPQAEMYKFLREKYPDLKKLLVQGFLF